MSWGNPTSGAEKLTARLLSPLSASYAVGAFVRVKAYQLGLPRFRLPVPVISVGNITCGGTGKTPVTISLARALSAQGHRVGILSRGYGRKNEKSLIVVSDGHGKISDFESSGDEPCLIARSVPDAVVIACASRKTSGTMAINDYECDLLILDDGFQHLPVKRDYDLVLIDYEDEPENDALLPAGRLREPLAALGRATAFAITKIPAAPDQEKLARLKNLLRRFNADAPIYCCRFAPTDLVSRTGKERSLDQLKDTKVVAFCGLARSEQFFRSLEILGANLVKKFAFPDHHLYSHSDFHKLVTAAADASLIVTTEKDLIKLGGFPLSDSMLFALRMETVWLDGMPEVMRKESAGCGQVSAADDALAASAGAQSSAEQDYSAGSTSPPVTTAAVAVAADSAVVSFDDGPDTASGASKKSRAKRSQEPGRKSKSKQ